MIEAKLIRAVRAALHHGHPHLTLEEVFAYTSEVSTKAQVQEALNILCRRNHAMKTTINGTVVYRRPVALHELPKQKSPGKAAPQPSMTQRALECIEAHNKPISTSYLRETLDLEIWQLQNVLRQLEARGDIATVGERRKGKPCRWVSKKSARPAAKEINLTKKPEPVPLKPVAAPEDKSAMNQTARVAPTPPNAEEIDTERRVNQRRYSYRSDGTLLMELPVYGPIELNRDETDTLFRYLNGVHEGIEKALEVHSGQL